MNYYADNINIQAGTNYLFSNDISETDMYISFLRSNKLLIRLSLNSGSEIVEKSIVLSPKGAYELCGNIMFNIVPIMPDNFLRKRFLEYFEYELRLFYESDNSEDVKFQYMKFTFDCDEQLDDFFKFLNQLSQKYRSFSFFLEGKC
jgi:hypothetical protein